MGPDIQMNAVSGYNWAHSESAGSMSGDMAIVTILMCSSNVL